MRRAASCWADTLSSHGQPRQWSAVAWVSDALCHHVLCCCCLPGRVVGWRLVMQKEMHRLSSGPELIWMEFSKYHCEVTQVGFAHLHLFVCPVQRCLTSTETIRTIKSKEPRTATLTFTQLPSSVPSPFSSMLLYVHRDCMD